MDTTNLTALLTADIPKVTWFMGLRQVDLAEITKTDEARWSRYLNGTHIGEIALNKFAKALDMKPYTLLFAVHLRREAQKLADDQGVAKVV